MGPVKIPRQSDEMLTVTAPAVKMPQYGAGQTFANIPSRKVRKLTQEKTKAAMADYFLLGLHPLVVLGASLLAL